MSSRSTTSLDDTMAQQRSFLVDSEDHQQVQQVQEGRGGTKKAEKEESTTTTTQPHWSTIMNPSQCLFQSVAETNYSILLQLFAHNARNSVVSFLAMKRHRWGGGRSRGGNGGGGGDGRNLSGLSPSLQAEEKLDEFLQQLSYQESPSSSSSSPNLSPLSAARQEDDTSYAYLLQVLTSLLQEEEEKERQNQIQMKQSGEDDEEEAKTLSSSSPPSSQKPSPTTTATDTTATTTEDSSSSFWSAACGMVSPEADRLVWEASSLLSDARPPTNFFVYTRQGDMTPPASSSSSSSMEESSEQQQQQHHHNHHHSSSSSTTVSRPPTPPPPQPPLFDGSVANATPPPLGGIVGGATAGGGAGTILHLACAMDQPLILAFLLCMGADARSSHTAFRRLMIHEAACNGSIQCLSLLLELGHDLAQAQTAANNKKAADLSSSSSSSSNGTTTRHHPHGQQSSYSHPNGFYNYHRRPTTHNSQSNHRSSSSSSAPFFPHAAPAFGGSERQSYPSSQFRLLRGRYGQAKGDNTYNNMDYQQHEHYQQQEEKNNKMDFLTLLQHFQTCYQKVQAGLLTELEAARSLLAHAWLPDSTRQSLIRSCVFSNHDSSSSSSSHGRSPASSFLLRPHGCADGHGNTPLHWAAFKNETPCVSLLLEYKANANARAHPSGWTPLHDAAYSNSGESIELLIHQGGAQVDARANSGATPLCFAAQEDAAHAARLLLKMGADLSARCAGGPALFHSSSAAMSAHRENQLHGGGGAVPLPPPPPPPPPHSRFSGYTPLHYCAHYNAHNAAKVLLRHSSAKRAMETPDLSERLPIHVAVARGSSDVLRELLHAGARIDIRPGATNPSSSSSSSSAASGGESNSSASSISSSRSDNTPVQFARAPSPPHQQQQPQQPRSAVAQAPVPEAPRPAAAAAAAASGATAPDFLVAAARGGQMAQAAEPGTPVRRPPTPERPTTPGGRRSTTPTTGRSTPVSSPLLRSMIPSQPITSSKPWNCLSQQAIDECRNLITNAEQSWAPDRHLLFTPQDRKAVMELLRVGKRLEQQGTGLCVRDLWPLVLSFCGRGWFEPTSTTMSEAAMMGDSKIPFGNTRGGMEGLLVGTTNHSQLLIQPALSLDQSMEEEEENEDEEEYGDESGEGQGDDYLALPNLSR